MVGVDDWALRKGRAYGTIVADLERRRAIDLLPDRSAPTLAAWLRRRPHIAPVARDRPTECARAAAPGAPGAAQVAGRWHLLFNTRQMVERWLTRAHPRPRRPPPTRRLVPTARRSRAYPRAPSGALARAEARGRWEALYGDDTFPRHDPRGPAPSILDAHLGRLHARLPEGCENAMQLWREARDRGFAGTPKQIRRWLSERRSKPANTTVGRWRRTPSAEPDPATASALPPPKRLLWLLAREADELSPEETALVARVTQDREAAKVAGLGRGFCRIVRCASNGRQQRGGASEALDAWLAEARGSGVRVVESFAASLDQDGAAVRAALTLPWSNGQAEGQINRLKLLKRTMYGRAGLDLLRRRFILAA